ncbi:XdhC family protein [Marinobacter sp. SS13-12]|uniref:XdhC family protein n=1 Tax=Marinobacter sp. SS13-12 TaxID=3050451 RepID=UPI0025545294|nr:XdhC family protein [Marinobacter sp. SS13-12]MDK8465468.1 XdhC family protein [Marinobacter sp. SS13-12]
MQNLDYRVVERAIEWLRDDRAIWLCTVVSTFGSSPREPGSLMVATADGQLLGSLSGGCVEEDFLARLTNGEYQLPAVIVRYGAPEGGPENARVRLPCGGILEVLVERMAATNENLAHLREVLGALGGEKEVERQVSLTDGKSRLEPASATGPRVVVNDGEEVVRIRIGPVAKLILAGYSTVAEACANFAISLGYQVVLCDPREEVTRDLELPGEVEFIPQLPSLYIASPGTCTPSTAVVAVTHDPRIDDLAMMAAVKTAAGYIGVMGSVRTSRARAERLLRTGGLGAAEIERIHMPIGLDLGSKTPAEIALAIMADIVRVRRGRVPVNV